MDKPQIELNKIRSSSRDILVIDVISSTILFVIFMVFIRDKFIQIFKEMNIVPATLFHKILYENTPIVLIVVFVLIMSMFILREKIIKNKTITYFINSFVLIALIVSIIYFGLCIFFLPLYDAPITSLK